MAAKSADSARAKAIASTTRRASVAKSKAADATARASMPKMVKNVVSQATINKIKSDGMTAALKKVGAGKASATYTEGVKRMYGANRIVAAKKSAAAGQAKERQNAIVSSYGYKPPKSRGGSGRAQRSTM